MNETPNREAVPGPAAPNSAAADIGSRFLRYLPFITIAHFLIGLPALIASLALVGIYLVSLLVWSGNKTPDSPSQEASREAATDEFSSLIASCMEKLDARHRDILTLRNSLNHSYDEIAQTLGINVGTVKSRIARARENLRALLAEMCPEFAPESAPADWFEPNRASGRLAAA